MSPSRCLRREEKGSAAGSPSTPAAPPPAAARRSRRPATRFLLRRPPSRRPLSPLFSSLRFASCAGRWGKGGERERDSNTEGEEGSLWAVEGGAYEAAPPPLSWLCWLENGEQRVCFGAVGEANKGGGGMEGPFFLPSSLFASLRLFLSANFKRRRREEEGRSLLSLTPSTLPPPAPSIAFTPPPPPLPPAPIDPSLSHPSPTPPPSPSAQHGPQAQEERDQAVSRPLSLSLSLPPSLVPLSLRIA